MKATVRSIDVRINRVLTSGEAGNLAALGLDLGFDTEAIVTDDRSARVEIFRPVADEAEDLSVVIAKLLVILNATRRESFDEVAAAVVASARQAAEKDTDEA